MESGKFKRYPYHIIPSFDETTELLGIVDVIRLFQFIHKSL